jgi:hypothetical protein
VWAMYIGEGDVQLWRPVHEVPGEAEGVLLYSPIRRRLWLQTCMSDSCHTRVDSNPKGEPSARPLKRWHVILATQEVTITPKGNPQLEPYNVGT